MPQPADIPELVERLWSKEAAVVEEALAALREIGAPALPALLAALEKQSKSDDAQKWEVESIKQAIMNLGEPALVALCAIVAGTTDANWRLQRAAARLLSRFDDARAPQAMITALRNPKNEYMTDLMAIFTARKDPGTKPVMIELLAHPANDVRHHAAVILYWGYDTPGEAAVQPLIHALRLGRSQWDSNHEFERSVGMTLWKIGTPALEAILAIQDDPAPVVQRAICEALGRFSRQNPPDPRAVAAYARCSENA